MTLIRSSEQVTNLIREMVSEWPPDDPDLQRIADALPLRCLELALVKKADEPTESRPLDVGQCATTASQKLAVMRQIFAAWLRAPGVELGELITYAIDAKSDQHTAEFLVFAGDTALAARFERRQPTVDRAARAGIPSPR
jgi:hypothetical protein